MCAGGAGVAFALRASGRNPTRRLAVGALAGSYALYGSASSTRRGGGGTKQRSTAPTVEGVAKDISLSVVAMLPFLSSALSRATKRFSTKNAVGVLLSSSCLLGALACDFKPPELKNVSSHLESKSRHPSLFLEWLHWYGYVLLGGGVVALIAGPIAMFGKICYDDLPSKEKIKIKIQQEEEEGVGEVGEVGKGESSYRHRQRTVSAFWPIWYSNRYISDHHLYETIVQDASITTKSSTELEKFIVGEWVVDVDVRPISDHLLGRASMTLEKMLPKWVVNNLPQGDDGGGGAGGDGVTSAAEKCSVLITLDNNRPPSNKKGSALPSVLIARYTDGRTYRLVSDGDSRTVGKYTVHPILPTEEEDENFWTRIPSQMFNWIAADGFRIDPNEYWFLQTGAKDDDAYVVLSDGDMRSRYQALRRPGNVEGGLNHYVRERLLKQGREIGFVE